MCELGEKLKNVGERSKAGQKLNRKRNLRAGRAKDRRAKGTFFPGPGILQKEWGKKKEKEKKK